MQCKEEEEEGRKRGMEEANNLGVAPLLWKNKAKSGKGRQLLFRDFSHLTRILGLWTQKCFFEPLKRSLFIIALFFLHVSEVAKASQL